jgi:hypothetical protein
VEEEKVDKAKELELLHKAILLEESEVIEEGIERLHTIGNASSIAVVSSILCGEKEQSEEIVRASIRFLFTKEIEGAIPVFIEQIGIHIGKANCRYLLAACWEVNYDCSKFIKQFSLIAAHASVEELIECLSIFENMVNVPALEDVIYAIKQIDVAIEKSTDSTKTGLLESIRNTIKSFQ